MKTLPALSEVDLIVFDFDGVMTDNRVYVFEDGREAVQCNRADGQGCELLRASGVEMMILSTEKNTVVSARAEKLRVPVHQGTDDKAQTLRQILSDRNVDPARVVYVGNDVNDQAAMELIGWPVAPSDAHESILVIAKHITTADGGGGVVRELADLLVSEDADS